MGAYRKITLASLASLVGVSIAVLWSSMRWLQVHRQVISFDNLPEHLVGLRIMQIADLHNRSNQSKTLNIWPTVNKLNADIAVITGDLILDKVSNIHPHAKDLAELAKRMPTFFIEGNHEGVKRFDDMKVFLQKLGITVLDNQAVSVGVNGGSLEIIGTRDYITLIKKGRVGLVRLFAPYRRCEQFQLVLTHQPQTVAWFDGGDLILSGHTHGGQLRLPFVPTLYAPQQGFFPKYGSGLYELAGRKLYVSRGIGATHFPFRFFNRPELTLLTLDRSN